MYHTTVLLNESVESLVVNPDGVYVDATFGGGGHSKLILDTISDTARLMAIDQDSDAARNLVEDDRFTLQEGNFRFLKHYLNYHRIEKVDGVLADLGVSGFQFDEGQRGFSIRFDGPLDMRMNRSAELSAADVLRDYSHGELARVFQEFGEVKFAGKVAAAVVSHRQKSELLTTGQLVALLKGCVPPHKHSSEIPKVFQAIRIEVNDEIGALKDLLIHAAEVLKPGGRLVVLSYHSLEDRLVKEFFRSGNFNGTLDKDLYGNVQRPLDPLSNKAVMPSENEIKSNPRARSARLRVGVKR